MVAAPDYIAANARRGLRLLEFAGDGLRQKTINDARRIASGTVPHEKIRLMGPWFARHRADLNSRRARAYLNGDTDRPSPGQVAWLLWGGSITGDVMAAARWAERQAAKAERSHSEQGAVVESSTNRAASDAASCTSLAPETK